MVFMITWQRNNIYDNNMRDYDINKNKYDTLKIKASYFDFVIN